MNSNRFSRNWSSSNYKIGTNDKLYINFVVYPEWLSDQGENMQFYSPV